MEAKISDFFVIDDIEGNPKRRKTNGVVFEHEGRIIGRNFTNCLGYGNWENYDIKTGLPVEIGWIFLDEDEKLNKLLYQHLDSVNYKDWDERCANEIKKAYDEHPEIKRQVFEE